MRRSRDLSSSRSAACGAPSARRGLLRAALGWALGIACVSRLAVARDLQRVLPVPKSMQLALEEALAHDQPLVVMVSLPGCPYCRIVREQHLLPLLNQAGPRVVQVDLNDKRELRDFSGQRTTHDAWVRQWGVQLAPTVMFFGAQGREVAPRLSGALLPDFYGAYLEERLAQARRDLRVS